MSAARRVAATAWPVLLATVAVSLVVAPYASPAGGAGPHTKATFVLDDQSQWVLAPTGPSSASSTPSSPFDLGLSARGAPPGAMVEALLYPRLRTRYDFKNVVREGPRGSPLATTSPVALTSLPPDTRSAGVSLDLSVVQTASNGEGPLLGLACAPPTGSGTCTGVYPLVVELQGPSGRVLRRFTTFLTYVAGKSAHPLELSWVVPVAAPVTLAEHPSSPARGIQPLSTPEASALEILISQLDGASTVPLTLEVSPETLQALKRAGPDGRAAVTTLSSLSANPSTDEILASPYVPINLGALAGAGEPTEVVAQMAAGATVLHRLHVKTTATPSPWVQTGPVGNDIAGGLAQVHATQLVLPDTDLAPTANATTSGTWVSTFSMALPHDGSTFSVQAAETDTWLDGQFTAPRGDPALAATQLLADLAMVHFERPNTTAVRGMVAVPPARWAANPVFDRVLLEGLTQNPVVVPVTLSRFFSSVTPAGSRGLLRSGSGPVMKRLLARALSHARVRLSNFDGAVTGPTAHRVVSELDDLLLASESGGLPAGRQAAGIAAVERVLTAQLHLVKFATEQTFTLTARSGVIPITIDSSARYTIVGRLSVSGNKFVFPHRGTRRVVRLDHPTNASRVDVQARSSGDLPLHVAFTSPNGRLVIARDLLIVRSTATSLVGVVLTVVALAVLLTWWARTWWSGRRRRRVHAGGSRGRSGRTVTRAAEGGAAAP